MPSGAVERAHRTFEAFNRGDVDAFVAGFDREIEWHFNPAFLDSAGTVVRGHQGMRRYLLDDILALWCDYRTELEELEDLGSHLFIVVRFRGLGRHSKVPVDMRLYEVYTLRGERPVKRESFTEREHAVEALKRAGVCLSESS